MCIRDSDGSVAYQIFAADTKDAEGNIQWEEIGQMVFNESYLSEGVDKNLLFYHPSLRSPVTGELRLSDTKPSTKREN